MVYPSTSTSAGRAAEAEGTPAIPCVLIAHHGCPSHPVNFIAAAPSCRLAAGLAPTWSQLVDLQLVRWTELSFRMSLI